MLVFLVPRHRSSLSIVAFLQFLVASSLAFTQCYYPDGSIPTDYFYEPCTGGEHSSCCIPTEGDICQDNGLCYLPEVGSAFRGACTDRTWNDPSCPVDICVNGFETTWQWALECEEKGSTKWACGDLGDGGHTTATCAMSATPKTAYKSTTTPSSASRYVSPPPINTALYSLYTETFTVTVSADVQSTTFTTTYESTLTSTLIPAKDTSTSAAATNSASTSTSVPIAKGKVTLTTGVLVAIIVGPIVAIAIGLGLFFWLRKRSKRNGMKLLDQPSHPPPNGPIGADQVHSYEVDLNPASGTPQSPKKYTYVPPVNELSGEHGAQSLSQEKRWGQAVEMGGYEHSPAPPPTPRSPAPAYTTYNPAAIAVELDGTSSMRGRGGWS